MSIFFRQVEGTLYYVQYDNYWKIAIVLTLTLHLQLVRSHDVSHTALKFGKDGGSYIHMQVNFGSLQQAFTICSWVRRMSNHAGSRNDWLSYVGSDGRRYKILLSDSSSFYLFGFRTYREIAITIGEWNHMCQTFQYSSRTSRVYVNGTQVATGTTKSGRTLRTTGSLMFGQYHYADGRTHSSHYFGGEIYDTNFYTKELSAEQIQEMFNQGRCSNYSQTLGSIVSSLSWGDKLRQERTGNVTEVDLEECRPTEMSEEETYGQSLTGVWGFLMSGQFYDKIISDEMLSKARDQFELLNEFVNHTIDDALILHLEKHHSGQRSNTTVEQSLKVKKWKKVP